MRKINVRSLLIFLSILVMLFAIVGCSITRESDGLKVVDVERGDSVNGLKADDDNDIMVVKVEATNNDAKGKLNELVVADDTDLFKLMKGDELVAEASNISKVSGDDDNNEDDALLEITFPVPKNINSDLFLQVESFPKIALDDQSS